MSPATDRTTLHKYVTFIKYFNELLASHNEQFVNRSASYDPHFTELIRTACEALHHSPYKRPYFAYLGFIGAGGTDNQLFTELGIGLELYDAALLLHDDIIDDDTVRNGRHNVVGAYARKLAGTNPEKTAASLGIICGDTLYGLAFEKLFNLPVATETQAAISQTLSNAHLVLQAGQCSDIITETQDLSELTEEQIIAGYKLKNQFNLEMPLQMGALAGGASQESAAAISSFAYPLGAAIQIANDIDVLFSDRFDSKTTADLRGNKKTLILWYAWHNSDEMEREFILSCMGNQDITRVQVAMLTELLEKTTSRQKAYDKGRSYITEATQALDAIDWLTGDAKQSLRTFIQSVEERLK